MSDADRKSQLQQHEAEESRPEPEDVPAISAQQPSIAGGIGAAYVGRDQDLNRDQLDQDSHVAPTDNDGETVPRDEVVDKIGG